jgi:hypothetical protein
VEFVAPFRGGSRPWLVRCSSGEYYVVKRSNNPQHPRILANEMVAGRLAQLLGLPVAEPAFVEFPLEMVEAPTAPDVGSRRGRWAPGVSFGSRFPGPPEQTLVIDFLPDRLLRRVENLAALFVGGFVFDKWTCNCEGRQVVFFRPWHDRGRPFSGLLIDQGSCFNGGEWSLPDSPIRSLYPQRLVYDAVTSLESFEPFISRVENLRPPIIEECFVDIPSEWCWPDPDAARPLIRRLYDRRKRLREMIIEAKLISHAFQNWL